MEREQGGKISGQNADFFITYFWVSKAQGTVSTIQNQCLLKIYVRAVPVAIEV
jgi:hypothetical protein